MCLLKITVLINALIIKMFSVKDKKRTSRVKTRTNNATDPWRAPWCLPSSWPSVQTSCTALAGRWLLAQTPLSPEPLAALDPDNEKTASLRPSCPALKTKTFDIHTLFSFDQRENNFLTVVVLLLLFFWGGWGRYMGMCVYVWERESERERWCATSIKVKTVFHLSDCPALEAKKTTACWVT